MIGQLPKIYPDELIYSWLTRYIVYSGMLYKKVAFREIYNKNVYIPNFEFAYGINEKIFNEIKNKLSIDEIIYDHTMFPEYTIYASSEKRKDLIDKMLNNFIEFRKDIHHMDHKMYYLKYCPLCAAEDKSKYGETYWHRIHQLRNISVCPIHFCQLYNVGVEPNYRNTVKKFYIANESVNINDVKLETNYYVNRLSQFIRDVFMDNVCVPYEKIPEHSKKIYPFYKVCKMYVCNIGTQKRNKKEMNTTKYKDQYKIQNAKKVADGYLRLKENNKLSWYNLMYQTRLKRIQVKNTIPYLKGYLSYEDIESIKAYFY